MVCEQLVCAKGWQVSPWGGNWNLQIFGAAAPNPTRMSCDQGSATERMRKAQLFSLNWAFFTSCGAEQKKLHTSGCSLPWCCCCWQSWPFSFSLVRPARALCRCLEEILCLLMPIPAWSGLHNLPPSPDCVSSFLWANQAWPGAQTRLVPVADTAPASCPGAVSCRSHRAIKGITTFKTESSADTGTHPEFFLETGSSSDSQRTFTPWSPNHPYKDYQIIWFLELKTTTTKKDKLLISVLF